MTCYRSSGFSVGVSIGASGITPTASLDLGVSGVASNLSAGGTARVTTPGALGLQGATLSGERVEVSAESLSIESEQDTSSYASRQSNIGL